MNTERILVARQPIYDRRVRVVGYEVLHRAVDPEHSTIDDADAATARVSVSAILDIGLDQLVGASRAFINITREVLVLRHYEFLPADRVVLEVLEDVAAEREVLDELGRARAAGYTIALDDWVGDARLDPLLEYADIVKVDLPKLNEDELARVIARLPRAGRQLLAEKVETRAQFEHCRRVGFDLFQGYFFARPRVVRGARLPVDRLSLVRLLARVHDASADIEEIERLVAANVSLSYQLLRYVNSAVQGVPQRIESLRHAVLMLGLDRVRMCVMMLVLAGLDDKPHELLVTALVRARYCQVIATLQQREAPQQYFTAGLLSVLDAFMDRPMDELLAELSIAPELEAALLRREGALGEVLDAAIACERADWPRLLASGIDTEHVRTAYVGALGWAAATESEISGIARRAG